MEVSTSPDSMFSRLPPQLLALVLAHIQQAERLGSMARVCSAWRAAAVMATNSISAVLTSHTGLGTDRLEALSGWLQAYAAAAGLDSLTVSSKGSWWPGPITLPVQQLASLRTLDLDGLTVAVQGQADTQAAALALPPELSAITRLRLWSCEVGLGTLSAFTNLQHLALCTGDPPNSIPEVSCLLHLTHLHLEYGYAHDAVLGSVGALTSLQELLVVGGSYTVASFAALPVSLTKLWVQQPQPSAHTQPTPIITLDPATTPAVAALTALRWLAVHRVAGFSAALLQDMSSLQHLAVRHTPLLAAAVPAGGGVQQAARGLGLSALDGLTQLQHLELPQTRDQLAAEPTDMDVSALTASSQLTCLIINEGLVKQEQYCCMFETSRLLPDGQLKRISRELPELLKLRATAGFLATVEDVDALIRRCPKLQQLDLGTAIPDEEVLDVYDTQDGGDWCSAGLLGQLESLTRLVVNLQGDEGTDAFWSSMTNLEELRELEVSELDIAHFGGIVALASFYKLTSLMLAFKNNDPWPFEMKNPAGQAPEIWRTLPQKALTTALEHYIGTPSWPWDVQASLRSMSRAAAEHSLQLEREVAELQATVAHLEGRQDTQEEEVEELQGEVTDLQGEVADLQGEVENLQGDVSTLEGEVGDLKAMVVALGAQVKELQQRNSMQQG